MYTHDGNESIIDSFIYNVSDPNGTYSHATVTLTINSQNDPPNIPINIKPYNGEINVITNPILKVNVSDPDGDNLNVSFYDINNNLIGIDTNVSSGYNASIIWSGLSYSKTYYWYAVANDSKLATKSANWNFKTKGAPAPPPPSEDNFKPVADASAGKPYYGFVLTMEQKIMEK
ncbi:MAG: hypothetical protein AYK22_07975 [Thermoplasmatales archaeon SG8-52-3]|nr:MAG: hypothetical protein AYK22_07975 [Thermoplasmatales archaeon SG8-52-3]